MVIRDASTNIRYSLQKITGLFLVMTVILVTPMLSQTNNSSTRQQDESTISGTVVSSTRNTMVVKSENGQYQLFVYERDTVKPRFIATGSKVRVVSTAGDEAGVRTASTVTLLEASPKAQPGTRAESDPAVPPVIRQIERDIERQARRYRAGVRTGVALDPELVLIGVHAEVGPFFRRDISLRPNVEFAFGEVTALFALNLEAIYRLPITSRQGRWSSYIGAGPGFSFLHQNFERSNGVGGKKVDFGEFHSSTGLNILGGIVYRSGMFLELKTSVYSRPAPTLRLILGYNF